MTQQEYLQQFETFQQQSVADGRFAPRIEDQNAILNDDGDQTIHISWDYWVHTAWAARKLKEYNPYIHDDFGSYVYFAGIASAFIPDFRFHDVRPVNFPLGGMKVKADDLTCLPHESNSMTSISCLHVMEHVGLGRYGDKLDASGDRKAAGELARVLALGGQLLMVVPMNERPRVHFNAHRFYSFHQVVNEPFFPGLSMTEFNVLHAGRFISNADLRSVGSDDYTACMVFTK